MCGRAAEAHHHLPPDRRHLLLREMADEEESVDSVIQDCERFLFTDKQRLIQAVREDDISTALSCLRLLPSDTDRLPFLFSVLGNRSEAQSINDTVIVII